jgi:hypothetical protein
MDCLICGVETDQFSCTFNHKYHRLCLYSEHSIKKRGRYWCCLLCDAPLKAKKVIKTTAPVGDIGFEKRPSRCVGTTAKGKRCRNKGQGGWCHIHKVNDALLEV